MPDAPDVFAPQPRRVSFVLVHEEPPRTVEAEVWNFMDLPCGDAEKVLALEKDLRESGAGLRLDTQRALLALFAPKLPKDVLEALVPSQLLAGIGASYGPPRDAEADGAASRSASASSTTLSPLASGGALPT